MLVAERGVEGLRVRRDRPRDIDGVVNTGFEWWWPADWPLSDGLGESPKQYPQPAGTRPSAFRDL